MSALNPFRLPFTAKGIEDGATPYWNVPATGGFIGGYETGEAMALAFLKFERAGGDAPSSELAPLVESFMRRWEQEHGAKEAALEEAERSHSFESFRGQYVGFFCTVSGWLSVAIRRFGSGLDEVADADLLARANAGLGFDQVQYLAARSSKG